MTTDPVASFYAPQVRLIDVATNDVVGGRVGAEHDHVDLDIVSARVTLYNTNVSQLQVVLNNQMFDALGRPVAPPWKYNALDRIKFGQRVRLDVRYGDQPWTKLILAQVNDLQFAFASSGPAQVTVVAEDLMCLLKRAPQADIPYNNDPTEETIARETFEAATRGATAGINVTMPVGTTSAPRIENGVVTVRAGLVEWPVRSVALPPQRHTKSQTYLQFLQQIAERMDVEMFVDFLHNYLPDTDPGVTTTPPAARPAGDETNDQVFHFEPSRSLIPSRSDRRVVDLTWGQNLLDFKPRLKLWELTTSVKVRGRPRGSATALDRTIEGADADAIVATDLADQAGAPSRAIPATQLRRTLLGDAALPTQKQVEFTNLDEERALIKARKVLLDGAREMLTVDATTIGFPSLRPGVHVRIQGLYAPFNGIYYVTQTTHTIDGTGYKTQLNLRRPGMLSPDLYPHKLAQPASSGASA